MNKQLLDPLGTICKLVALNFNRIKTKVSIQNYVLTLQKPNGYQWMIRLYNGDGRENISELYYAIIRVVRWYLVKDYKQVEELEVHVDRDNQMIPYDEEPVEEIVNGEETIELNSNAIADCVELRKLIQYLCDAFTKLQQTYEYGNVVLALQFYINLLRDGLNGVFDDNRLPKYILDKEKEYENLLDYEKLKNLWEVKNIKRVCKLYDSCFKVRDDPEMSEEEKRCYINGYLKSIETILKITDKGFQKLIVNSNKG